LGFTGSGLVGSGLAGVDFAGRGAGFFPAGGLATGGFLLGILTCGTFALAFGFDFNGFVLFFFKLQTLFNYITTSRFVRAQFPLYGPFKKEKQSSS
jgi:hypothetical protein